MFRDTYGSKPRVGLVDVLKDDPNLTGCKVEIIHNPGEKFGFYLCKGDDIIAQSNSDRALSDWALGYGAQEVRCAYDLTKGDAGKS